MDPSLLNKELGDDALGTKEVPGPKEQKKNLSQLPLLRNNVGQIRSTNERFLFLFKEAIKTFKVHQ